MITLAEEGATGIRRRLEVQDLAEHHAGFRHGQLGTSRTRRECASWRLLIDEERHLDLIIDEIYRKFKTPVGRKNIAAHADTTNNVLRRVADRLSVAYEKPPVRDFGKAPKRTAERMIEALAEGHFDLQAELWARYALLMNVVHVLPRVVDGELRFDTVLPHASEVIIDEDDQEPSILIYEAVGPDYTRVAVDSERYWFLDDNWQLVRDDPHGYRDVQGRPMRPWVPWRVRPRLPGQDYWLRKVGSQLVDATLYVGRVSAHMSFVRQNNNTKLAHLSADRVSEDVPPEQQTSPERPLVTSGNASFEVHDLIVPITEFVADINFKLESVAESYGVPRGVLGANPASSDASPLDLGSQAAVSKMRTQHAKHLRVADRKTVIMSAIIMKAERHRLAVNPRTLARELQVHFGEHTFVEKPLDALAVAEKKIELGQQDQVRLFQESHPWLTIEQSRAQVELRLKTRAEINEFQAARQTPTSPGQDFEGLAASQGRVGGQAQPSDPDGIDDGREQPNE